MSLWFERPGPDAAASLSELDALCFEKAWPVQLYRAELTSSRSVVEWCGLEAGGEPVGWLVQWIVADESQVLRVAAIPSARRHGVGRALLRRAIERAERAKCAEIVLEVGSQNQAARKLYAGCGFETIGLRKGYYSAPPDDAVVMSLRLAREPDRLGS